MTQQTVSAEHRTRSFVITCMDCGQGHAPLCDACRSDRACEAQLLRACLAQGAGDAAETRWMRRRLERLQW